jgi:hypothetical protein
LALSAFNVQRFALLALGRTEILFGSRKNSKPEKCSKMPQNPQRPVHALLGNLYAYQNDGRKKYHRKHDKILHATLIFTRTKKTVTTKRLLQKMTLLNEPERKF